jgi:hypothetical protein
MQSEVVFLNLVFKYVRSSWIHIQSAELDNAEAYQGVRCWIIMSVPERENIVLQHSGSFIVW